MIRRWIFCLLVRLFVLQSKKGEGHAPKDFPQHGRTLGRPGVGREASQSERQKYKDGGRVSGGGDGETNFAHHTAPALSVSIPLFSPLSHVEKDTHGHRGPWTSADPTLGRDCHGDNHDAMKERSTSGYAKRLRNRHLPTAGPREVLEGKHASLEVPPSKEKHFWFSRPILPSSYVRYHRSSL